MTTEHTCQICGTVIQRIDEYPGHYILKCDKCGAYRREKKPEHTFGEQPLPSLPITALLEERIRIAENYKEHEMQVGSDIVSNRAKLKELRHLLPQVRAKEEEQREKIEAFEEHEEYLKYVEELGEFAYDKETWREKIKQ